mmetsp:Transcript_1706/g.5923  ORF Transcript_1706/g.5923 Transcript_1706/m.5923 type:complete len:1465 (+) Transcript_1706:50-4444(+)
MQRWWRQFLDVLLGCFVVAAAQPTDFNLASSTMPASVVPLLEAGYPLLISDLPSLETRCFVLRLPAVKRVRVLASVVALAGSPILQGGWVPQVPGPEAAKEAGFQTLVQDFERQSAQYYICLRTFSTQGCDALLTAIAIDAAEDAAEPPPLWLRPSYPAIWPLDGGGEMAPKSLRFVLHADDLDDLRVSLVPVSGQVDVDIHIEEAGFDLSASSSNRNFAKAMCSGQPAKSLSALSSPDVIEVLHTERPAGGSAVGSRRILCVRIAAAGDGGAIASLTVGPRLPGPFLAPGVSTGGRFVPLHSQILGKGGEETDKQALRACESMRLLVNSGSDITLTATAEDGSRLLLRAALASELLMAPVADRWSGETTPGGVGAVLVLRGADIGEATAASDEQGEACLSIAVCRFAPVASQEKTRFWVTAVTDRDVVTLEDGLPFATSLRAPTNESARSWRDFRFLVPGGHARPLEITISATSSGEAKLVADTRRYPHNAHAFRWASTAKDSSHPVIRLTTDPALASEDVWLLDCRFPCFIYISADASVENSSGVDADLEIQVQTDASTIKPLLEAQEEEETLAGNEVQVFRYRTARHGSAAALFSLSVSEGSATFEVSASADFPDDPELTTRPADDVVLLEPFAAQYKAAAAVAKPLDHSPVLFVRVKAGKASPSEFALVARAAGSVTPLFNGEDTRGGVEARGYDRFGFFLGPAETRDPLKVVIDVDPLTGVPDVWVACSPNEYPRAQAFDWRGGDHKDGEDRTRISFTTDDAKFKPGWVYLGITGTGHVSAYTVRVRWESATPHSAEEQSIQLQDGMEELGQVALGVSQQYELAVSNQPDGRPVVLRLEAFSGSVQVCIEARGLDGSHDTDVADCLGILAVAKASDVESGGVLALDLPTSLLLQEPLRPAKGTAANKNLCQGCVRIRVSGFGASGSRFGVRALVAARAATVVEEHKLVADMLGPTCCNAKALQPASFGSHYLHFLRPPAAAVSSDDFAMDLELRALGRTLEGGIRLGARLAPGSLLSGARSAVWSEFFPGHSSLDSSRLQLHASLAQLLAGVEQKRDLIQGGFWLEVIVETARPLNFTLRFGEFVAAPAARAISATGNSKVELPPNAVVSGVFDPASLQGMRYEFDMPAASKEGPWRLHVRSCYGHVSLRSKAVDMDESELEDVDSRDVPLVAARAKRAVDDVERGSVLVLPANGEVGTSFELGLLPPTSEDDDAFGGLVLPVAPVLVPVRRRGIVAFSFGSASFHLGAKIIRHTLVISLRNDTRLNANTSCGLQEALKRGLAVASRPVEVAVGQSQKLGLERKMLIPPLGAAFQNRSLWVNVLVEAVGLDGHVLHARSYAALALSAEDSLALVARSAEPSQHLVYFLVLALLLGAGVAVWGRRGLCPKACELPQMDMDMDLSDGLAGALGTNGKRGAGEKGDVELEVQYSLHQEKAATGTSYLQAPRGSGSGYVPPSV